MVQNNTKNAPKPLEVIKIAQDADEVVCNGGGGPLGHPQVWYKFEDNIEASCHYCGRKFVKTPQ